MGASQPLYRVTFGPNGASAGAGSRYGGQPAWIGDPQWPIDRETGEPMTFVMQFELPEGYRVGGHRVAYVFIDASEEQEVYPCDPECGHNAVILQGGGVFEPCVMVANAATGPVLKDGAEGVITIQPARRGDEFPEVSMIGAEVRWLQDEEPPPDGPWRLVLQMESEHMACEAPFEGWAYVFVSEDGRRARFLYQMT